MAVAHDTSSMSPEAQSVYTSVGSYSWTHTPVGTPKGILVFSVDIAAAVLTTAMSYGGVALSAVASGSAVRTSGEVQAITAWFLGSGIPTGAQTVTGTRTNNVSGNYAYCVSVTGEGDTDYAGVSTQSGSAAYAEQSVNDGSPGSNSVRYACGFSGLSTLPVAGASSTLLNSKDTGVNGSLLVRETTAGQGSRSVGLYAVSADDVVAVYLAIIEPASAGGFKPAWAAPRSQIIGAR